MTAPLMTWYVSEEAQVGGDGLAIGMMQAIKTALDAYVAANPSTASWAVVGSDFSISSTRHVTIARRDGSAGRICLFSSTIVPHADAIEGSSLANALYIGYAPLATETEPQQLANIGALWPQWVQGRYARSGSTATYDYFRIFDSLGGLVFYFSNSETASRMFGAGELFIGPDTNAYYGAFSSGGGNPMSSTWMTSATTASASAYYPFASENPSLGGAGGVWYFDADRPLRRVVGCDPDFLSDVTASRRQFLPFFVGGEALIGFPWKLRQIAYGAHGVLAEQLLEAGGTGQVLARGMSPRRGVSANGAHTMWATNFAI